MFRRSNSQWAKCYIIEYIGKVASRGQKESTRLEEQRGLEAPGRAKDIVAQLHHSSARKPG